MADALQLLVPILSGFEANKGEKILFFSLFLAFGISCAGQPSNASESPSAQNKKIKNMYMCVRKQFGASLPSREMHSVII